MKRSNRTKRLKRLYFFAVGLLTFLAVGLASLTGNLLLPLFLLVLVMVLPGRLQAVFYRDLFTARRLQAEGRNEESIVHTGRFLETIRERPALKRLLILSSFYTVDVEAMALNNLGAAQLQLGRWDEADAALRKALELDPEYPIPWFNLAVLAAARGDEEAARRLHADAESLGYRGTRFDKLVRMGQELRAKIDRADVTRPAAPRP